MAANQRYVHIVGWGMEVPERRLTNADLERMVETSDEWITTRTGIKERRIAREGETTATLALGAARKALQKAGVSPADLDLIIVASATPEHAFPATACLVQDALGADRAGAFDLSAACSGFLYGLCLASQAIRTGAIETALVIGSETLSRIVDWKDRNTCVLFGDGAGAVVLTARPEPGGVLACTMRADGSGGPLLELPAGGSRYPTSLETLAHNMHTIKMKGREIFRFAVRVMADAARHVVEEAGLTMDEVALLIPHQANRRIIEAAANRLKLPMERVYLNLDRYGNTSSASIPIALTEAVEEGRLRPGDHVVMVAFGAGLTWAGVLVQWAELLPVAPPTPRRRLRERTQSLVARIRSSWRRTRRYVWGLVRRLRGEPPLS